MNQLSVAAEVELNKAHKQYQRRVSAGSAQLRLFGAVFWIIPQILSIWRTRAPILISHHMGPISHVRIRSYFMKKSIAILLVAGAVAVSGVSATAAVSASSSSDGNTSVAAPGWWPDAKPQARPGWWPDAKPQAAPGWWPDAKPRV
jgi:hypothetical protein